MLDMPKLKSHKLQTPTYCSKKEICIIKKIKAIALNYCGTS